MKAKASTSNIDQELLDQIDLLQAEIRTLRTNNTKLSIAVKEAGLEDEDVFKISDAEAICVEQIIKLKEQSSVRQFTQEDAKILDILHRNLLLARGKLPQDKKSKTKHLSADELLEIIKN